MHRHDNIDEQELGFYVEPNGELLGTRIGEGVRAVLEARHRLVVRQLFNNWIRERVRDRTLASAGVYPIYQEEEDDDSEEMDEEQYSTSGGSEGDSTAEYSLLQQGSEDYTYSGSSGGDDTGEEIRPRSSRRRFEVRRFDPTIVGATYEDNDSVSSGFDDSCSEACSIRTDECSTSGDDQSGGEGEDNGGSKQQSILYYLGRTGDGKNNSSDKHVSEVSNGESHGRSIIVRKRKARSNSIRRHDVYSLSEDGTDTSVGPGFREEHPLSIQGCSNPRENHKVVYNKRSKWGDF